MRRIFLVSVCVQWRFYTVPVNPGDPGLETRKNLDAARHGGGGAVWTKV